jgi:hypothetical protein
MPASQTCDLQFRLFRVPLFALASAGAFVAIILLRLTQSALSTNDGENRADFEFTDRGSLVDSEHPVNSALNIKGEAANASRSLSLNVAAQSRATNGSFVPHGEFLLRHDNGQPALSGKYEHGIRVGTWRRWDTTGHLLTDDTYLKQESIRRFIEYGHSGRARIAGEYTDGAKSGVWQVWNEFGARIAEIKYTE